MIILIIILIISSIGWLYILCRLLNRIAAISDKLVSLTLFGGTFLLLTPFLFYFWFSKLKGFTSGLYFFNPDEIFKQNPLSLLFVLIGFSAFSGELIRRKIVEKLKKKSIGRICRLQSTRNVDCGNFFPKKFPWKYIYKIARLIPGNKIHKLYLYNYKISPPGNFNHQVRIVHITDIHFVERISDKYYEKMVSAVNEYNPDIILFTGDFLQNSDAVSKFKLIFSKFKAKSGIYFVCGNHDIWHKKVHEITTVKMLEEINFVHLNGKIKKIEINGENVYIAGTEQPWIKDNIVENLASVPDDSFVILLSHTPDNIHRIPLRNIKLVLSGHTHGGQNALPGLGPLIIPSKYGSAHASGYVKVKDSLLYISRGVALHHPLRIMCPLEIAYIDIDRTK